MYRYVPKAKRELQRMVFNTDSVKIDLESSKMIGESEHLLVLQSVSREQSGEYKCQITMDSPPFQFIQSAAYLSIMVLPERHPVISGMKICLIHTWGQGSLINKSLHKKIESGLFSLEFHCIIWNARITEL